MQRTLSGSGMPGSTWCGKLDGGGAVILEVTVLWIPGALEGERFYLAALLACLPMIGFFPALFTRRFCGGTLSDPGGIPPVT